jgi:hypothetical protein
MKNKLLKYKKYFRIEDQVKMLIRLNDKNFIDNYTEISEIKDDRVRLEVLGGGVRVHELADKIGTDVSLSGSSGWGLYRCNALLEEVISNKEIRVRLVGEVDEQQRREYFRLDVELPVIYAFPADNHKTAVTEQWILRRKQYLSMPEPVMLSHEKGYKVVGWLGGDALMPQKINLSGGGVRMKADEFIEPGRKMLVDIFLPLAPPCIVSTVAEVVRCSEIRLNWESGVNFTTALKFVHIDEKDCESIISFIFSEQRTKLKADIEKKNRRKAP